VARREGGISYSSADQARRVEKAADRRLAKKAQDNVGKYIPTSNPRRKRTRIHFTEERMKNFERNRERKLRGEWLDNEEWFAMMDTARALKDHRILQLRASPAPAAYEVGK